MCVYGCIYLHRMIKLLPRSGVFARVGDKHMPRITLPLSRSNRPALREHRRARESRFVSAHAHNTHYVISCIALQAYGATSVCVLLSPPVRRRHRSLHERERPLINAMEARTHIVSQSQSTSGSAASARHLDHSLYCF